MPSLKSIAKKAKKAAGFTLDNLLSFESLANTVSRIPDPIPGHDYFGDDGGSDIGRAIGRVPLVGGALRVGFDVGLSPATLLTAGLGPAVSSGLRGLGPAGRIAAGFVAPVTRGGFASRVAGETAVGTAGVLGSRALEERAPEPLKPAAAIVGGLAGGAIALRSIPRGSLAAERAPLTGVGADAVRKITTVIDQARPIREQTETLKSAELGRRFSEQRSRFRSGEPTFESYGSSLGSLKGELPRADFKLPEGVVFDDADVRSLIERIDKHFPENRTGDWNTTTSAFRELVLNNKLPTRGELEKFEEVFGEEFVEAVLKHRGKGERFTENILEMANLPRALMSSLDISAPLNQAVMATSRKEWWKSWSPMLKAFATEKGSADALASVRAGKHYELGRRYELFEASLGRTGKREELFASRLADKFPFVRRSNRAYVTFLNKVRWDIWENTISRWERNGVEFGQEDLRKVANSLNMLTGRGNMPEHEIADNASTVFFSPRRLTSIVERMVYSPVAIGGGAAEKLAGRQLLPGSRLARQEAARDMVSFVMTGTAVLGLLNLTGAANIELDPRSSDFGKGKVGNVRYDPWGGFQQVARYVAQLASGQRKTSTGDVEDINHMETAFRFLESKLAPVPGLVIDMKRGRTMMGDSVDLTDEDDILGQVWNRMTPLALQSIVEAAKLEGLRGGIKALPAVAGVGAQAYESIPDMRERVLQEAAKTDSSLQGKTWDDLTPGEQQRLEQQHKEDFDKVRIQSDYNDERMELDEWARNEQRGLATLLSEGLISRDAFRNGMDKLSNDRRTRLDQARKDLGVQFDDDPNDIVTQWYGLRENATLAYGVTDPQILDAMQEEFYAKLDPKAQAKIDDLREYVPDPTVKWYFDDKKTIDRAGYWDVSRQAFDKYKSKLPAEGIDTMYELMAAITAEDDPQQQKRLVRILNAINSYSSILRERLRKKSPELDAALVRVYDAVPIGKRRRSGGGSGEGVNMMRGRRSSVVG